MRKRDGIEFLWDELKPFLPKSYTEEESIKILSILKQAKAMHKEEHGQTWDKSMDNFEARGRNEMRAWVDFEEYYEETYESNT
jgi:hypothetical protein